MLNVEPIPAFNDNYIWLLYREGSPAAWVVDPGDAEPVKAALAERNLTLAGVLITHHHFDHVGGLAGLTAGRDTTVYGPNNPKIDGITRTLSQGDEISVLDCRFEVFEVPGHTLDHIAYHAPDQQLLFCGDTLFAGGCGRMFEGTPQVMQDSLARLAALPGGTRVYCAHEYTLANLSFAEAVEPESAALQSRIAEAKTLRNRGIPTVPSTIDLERETNPFLRVAEVSVQEAARERGETATNDPAAVFASIREWKDNF